MISTRRRNMRVVRTLGGEHRGFTLAELLVVIGVIALLLAIIASPLGLARRQAMATRCAAQEKDIGIALVSAKDDFAYFPLWDDGGAPQRYTWIDVLIELNVLGNAEAAYCPEDPRPSARKSARGRQYDVIYPGSKNGYGVDYSYGIGVPLSAGGQSWRPGFGPPDDARPRRFENHDKYAAQRVLVGDAEWSFIYNLYDSGGLDWSYPTCYDNLVAYRHQRMSANFLFQDGHVSRVLYEDGADAPVNTARVCLWYPTEPINVGPEHEHGGNWYPDVPPIDSTGRGPLPAEVNPRYYTDNLLWSRIYHK